MGRRDEGGWGESNHPPVFGSYTPLELINLLRVSETYEVPNGSHIWPMGRLDDIQTALKPLKNIEKIEINIHDHFRTS